MFKTIAIGVDGREGGRDALALAARLADPTGADLVAVRDLPFDYAASPPHGDVAEERAYKEVERDLVAAGVHARIRVLDDPSPARALHRVAEGHHADLIVVGSTGHSPTGRVFAGDHAAGALHGSPCPVAVAPRGLATRRWHAPAVIGVGFDGRPESRQALDLAVALAGETGAAIAAISVVPDAARAAADEELRAAIRDAPVEISGRVVDGVAVDELVKLSAGVDLVVVGSRGWGPVRRVLAGSAAVGLMRASHCPVLVLPRGAATGEPGERDPITRMQGESHDRQHRPHVRADGPALPA
jgi:nucleotide-binding universal stress UspA family protein